MMGRADRFPIILDREAITAESKMNACGHKVAAPIVRRESKMSAERSIAAAEPRCHKDFYTAPTAFRKSSIRTRR